MNCDLAADQPVSEVLREGGIDAPASDTSATLPRGTSKTTRLPPPALEANAAHRLRRWLRVKPEGPTGWEQGAWRASVVLSGPRGRPIDVIPVLYKTTPLVPRLGVWFGQTEARSREVPLTLAVNNINPYRALTVTGIRLVVDLKLKNIPLGTNDVNFDMGAASGGERVGAGQWRAWDGRLAPSNNVMGKVLRRGTREAYLDLFVDAVCEDRGVHACQFRATGRAAIAS
jgi:hypothetical protein